MTVVNSVTSDPLRAIIKLELAIWG